MYATINTLLSGINNNDTSLVGYLPDLLHEERNKVVAQHKCNDVCKREVKIDTYDVINECDENK